MTTTARRKANKVIRETVRKRRPNVTGSWMLLVPSQPPLSFDSQSWLAFVGYVLEAYNDAVAPLSAGGPADYADLIDEPLIKFRDSILAQTR